LDTGLEFVEASIDELAIRRHLLDLPQHHPGSTGRYVPHDFARLLVDATRNAIQLSPGHWQFGRYASGVMTGHFIRELGHGLHAKQGMIVKSMPNLEWILGKMFAEPCRVEF
jgi:hypothetical protein